MSDPNLGVDAEGEHLERDKLQFFIPSVRQWSFVAAGARVGTISKLSRVS